MADSKTETIKCLEWTWNAVWEMARKQSKITKSCKRDQLEETAIAQTWDNLNFIKDEQ